MLSLVDMNEVSDQILVVKREVLNPDFQSFLIKSQNEINRSIKVKDSINDFIKL